MNILKSLCILGMATTALAMAASGQAASFDCAKATTKVEKAICADDGLSSLDDEMAAAYKLALKKGNASKIKSAQKDWLQERNSCASDDSGAYANMQECIKEQYNYRLFDLNRMVYLPQKLKACTDLVIDEKTTRFEGATPGEAGGEVFVIMKHHVGFFVVSVDGLSDKDNADKYMFNTKDFAKGDKVKVCLASVPKDCPPGDDRGKGYSITNYKNHKTFSGTPDWHSCGGA